MKGRDAIHLAFSGLRGGFVRTVLTILGLGVGVGAVLTVLTLGDAGESRVEEEIAKLGVNKVWIRSKDSRYMLQASDAQALFHATEAPACAGAYTLSAITAQHTSVVTQIAGFDASMPVVHAPKIIRGRTLKLAEFEQGSPVCLIDEALAERFPGELIGQHISVGNRRLRVVGVIKGMTMQTMSGGSGLLLMPIRTYVETFGGNVAEITLSVQQGQNAEQVAEQALDLLAGEQAFRADTLENEINAAREVVRIFVMVLICVAGVCMLTGGIGVMNVLLVSVRERRHEIGLIKAIGGTSAQVGLLFLLEAVAYAFLGGILGIILGAAMIRLFGGWIGLDAGLKFTTVLPVLVASTMLGIGVGVFPALKAASMRPVDALQCE